MTSTRYAIGSGPRCPTVTGCVDSCVASPATGALEAARCDGAGHLRTFRSVVLPLSGPLLAMSFPSILPMLIVFAVFQRYFVEGIARTGIG